jgi:hypothetical protein
MGLVSAFGLLIQCLEVTVVLRPRQFLFRPPAYKMRLFRFKHETLYDLGRRPVHFNSVLLIGAFEKGNAVQKTTARLSSL